MKLLLEASDLRALIKLRGHHITVAMSDDSVISLDGGEIVDVEPVLRVRKPLALAKSNAAKAAAPKRKRRKFSSDFKRGALMRIRGGEKIADVARTLRIHRSVLDSWRRKGAA
jgi:hypothetical protein